MWNDKGIFHTRGFISKKKDPFTKILRLSRRKCYDKCCFHLNKHCCLSAFASLNVWGRMRNQEDWLAQSDGLKANIQSGNNINAACVGVTFPRITAWWLIRNIPTSLSQLFSFQFPSFSFKCVCSFFPLYHQKLSVTWARVGWVDMVRVASMHTEQVCPTKGYGMRQLPIHFHLSALNGW